MKTLTCVILMLVTANICFAEVYSWEDKDGVHVVNDMSEIPKKYRNIINKSEEANHTEWTRFGSSSTYMYYINYTTVELYRGKPSAWFKATEKNSGKSLKTRFVANCKEHRIFFLAGGHYDSTDNMIDSATYYDNPSELTVTPDSITESAYKELCKQ